MKVVVFQSYRTRDVAPWISECLSSVKSWATFNSFDYYFFDDDFFNLAPDWYREKVNHSVHLVSDICRIKKAKEFLSREYDKAIWVDADVLIFNQKLFSIPLERELAFCKELWVQPSVDGRFAGIPKVNNAVLMLSKESLFIDLYINKCIEIVREKETFNHTSVGPDFLTEYNKEDKIDFIDSAGLFSPVISKAIIDGRRAIPRQYIQAFGSPIYACNFCATFQDINFFGIVLSSADFSKLVSILLSSEGRVINQYLSLDPASDKQTK